MHQLCSPRATAAKLVLGWISDKPTQRRHFKPLLAAVRLYHKSGHPIRERQQITNPKDTKPVLFFFPDSQNQSVLDHMTTFWLSSFQSRWPTLSESPLDHNTTPLSLVWILHMLNKWMERFFCPTALSTCDWTVQITGSGSYYHTGWLNSTTLYCVLRLLIFYMNQFWGKFCIFHSFQAMWPNVGSHYYTPQLRHASLYCVLMLLVFYNEYIYGWKIVFLLKFKSLDSEKSLLAHSATLVG